MKTTILAACVSTVLMTSLAVANEPVETRPASAPTVTSMGPNSEAVAVLMAVNDHEVKAAKMALAKDPGGPVAVYAQMLHDAHTSNQELTQSIAVEGGIAIKDTPAVETLKATKKAKREKLYALQSDAFEAAFIQAMVQDHVELLAKIDNELLLRATNAELLGHLRETRTHIAMHLEQAREIEGSLQASR